MVPGERVDAWAAGGGLRGRRMGRQHLFGGRRSQSWPRHPPRHFRQRLLHHGHLSVAQSHRPIRPAHEGHRRKQFRPWLRRRPRLRKPRRPHHPLHHGHFHVELSQRQSTFLHAYALRHELRQIIFPPRHASKRRGHSDGFVASEYHRRSAFRAHFISQCQCFRARDRHALVLFCRQLHALIFFSFSTEKEKSATAPTIPRIPHPPTN